MADCVCGHPAESHKWRETGTIEFETHRPHMHTACECGCREFRECVDWPTSEGWHWFAAHDPQEGIGLSMSVANDGGLTRRWCFSYDGELYDREEFEISFGPARFTKCEPNPYAQQQRTE